MGLQPRTAGVAATQGLFLGLTYMFVIARLLIRKFLVKRISWDDYFLILAQVRQFPSPLSSPRCFTNKLTLPGTLHSLLLHRLRRHKERLLPARKLHSAPRLPARNLPRSEILVAIRDLLRTNMHLPPHQRRRTTRPYRFHESPSSRHLHHPCRDDLR